MALTGRDPIRQTKNESNMATTKKYEAPGMRTRLLRFEQSILSGDGVASVDNLGDEVLYDDLTNN